MNKPPFAVAAAAWLALSAVCLAETVWLVQTTDIRKQEAWEVMTREEASKLQREIQEEARAFPTALAAAKKAWDADELFKKFPFPSSSFSPRKISQQGPFTDREVANKKKQARDDRRIAELVKEAKEKGRQKDPSDAIRLQNVDKAMEKLNTELTKILKRDVPLNGP